ncbi:Variant SH3 domain-containing protein 2 [Elsinoe fawcettii]|nr:Variant SH3 domain-containing protein 2 [Elsinoe fawcettii]
MSAPFKVKAVFEYNSPHDDDLSFPNGQVITVTEEEDADWYVGEYTDDQGRQQSGLFPKNFVEKYEPEIPSRPTRQSRPKGNVQSPPTQSAEFAADDEDAAPPPPVESKPAPAPVSQPEPVAEKPPPPAREEPRAAPTPAGDTPLKAEQPASSTPSKGPPPPVAAKSSSFKDRIAAFNKSADAPVLPFKPSGSGSNYGIKKPFVAPPPSRNAYVPPPKPEPVQKLYRREEDPEIAERLAEDRAAAETAGLASSQDLGAAEGEEEEDAPKPQSLKDRIALLQKQQMEQAQRRADAAGKEKPKRPQKKRTESSEQFAAEEEAPEESEKSLPIRTSQDIPDQPQIPRTRTLSPAPMSPTVREHDILSDGNEADQSAAGETTEANEDTSDPEEPERQRSIPQVARSQRAPAAPTQEADVGDEEDTTEGQSEEDEMDEETRRKLELRERMAKISGGMGMAGMFGPQPGMAIAPPRQKSTKSKEPRERKQSEDTPASPPQVPRAMVPVPGMMPQVASPQSEDTELAVEREEEPAGSITSERGPTEVPDVEDVKPPPPPKESRKSTEDRGAAPPIPGDRPVPLPPPTSSRPMPPAPPARVPQSPDPSEQPPQSKRCSVETPRGTEPPTSRGAPPPVPGARGSVDSARSPPPIPGQASYFGNDAQSEASIPISSDRRMSRGAPPPVPGIPPTSPPTQSRPPPPPPPAAAPVEEPDEGESEYEGDYDTDIASSDKHKAALKSHQRPPSLDESTTADDLSLQRSPPPIPTSPPTQHRAVPPPPPGQASRGKASTDLPRNAPPPLPPSRPPPADEDEDEEDGEGLDNYQRYQDSQRAAPPLPPSAAPAPLPSRPTELTAQDSSDDLYSAPTRKSVEAPRTVPPPPTETSPRVPEASRFQGRQSLDAARTLNRKSMDAPRPTTSTDGFIATDIDLADSTEWWSQPSTPPPVFQNRNDLLFEIEESSTSKRGGKTTINKDIYVLFHDYSQTVITATYDRSNPSDVSLDQRHEPPPQRLRQDQLESSWQQFGSRIAPEAERLANAKKDKEGLGDGTPASLAYELIKAQPNALLPVGNRAYGALVYANIGNASVQQFDEIRAGDMVTFRNAKLQGKHGLQKYSTEVGGGQGHVAVVTEWDGTKKKVRAVEQVKDEKGRVKVKTESYRLGDLKSGEVRVWRVVGRKWVGWDEEGK